VENSLRMSIIITFESWVTKLTWYRYAVNHRSDIPYLLIDRSPCTEPFFDHYTPPAVARPLISGLCRPRKNYQAGGRFIYLTRIDRDVLSRLGRKAPIARGAVYLGVASLLVQRMHDSHADAAATFQPAQYASIPPLSAYPPNLAHASYPGAAVDRMGCITHYDDVAHTPDSSTPAMHRLQYMEYHRRQRGLPVAECRFENRDGIPALVLNPHVAVGLSQRDWGDRKLNQRGIHVDEDVAGALVQRLVAPLRAGRA
jgi:hypothetical protein